MIYIGRKRKQYFKSFGVVGVSKNCGVTSLCLSIANYLASVRGKNVIYVELGDSSKLVHIMQKEFDKTDSYVRYKSVRYVLASTVKEAQEILQKENAYIIIDVQELNDKTKTVYSKCERQLIMASFRPWKIKELIEFVCSIKRHSDIKPTIVGGMIEKRKKKELKKQFDYEIIDLDYIEDPFSLKESNFSQIEQIVYR